MVDRESSGSQSHEQDFFELLFVSGPLPMWVYEVALDLFLAVNHQACLQYGYGEEEFLALTAAGICRPEDNMDRAEARAADSNDQRSSELWRHRQKDGTVIDVETNSSDILFRGKQARLVVAQDVTQRRRAEEARRLGVERLEFVTRSTGVVVWDYDVAKNHIWWSDNLQREFGIPPDQVEHTIEWLRAHIHPEDRERASRSMARAMASDTEQWAIEFRFRRYDGSYAFDYDRGFFVRDASGKVLRIVGAMTDLSDRRQRESALREQATLLDRARDAILVRGLDHRVRYMNKAAEFMYGLSRKQAIGKRVEEIVVNDDPAAFENADARVFEKSEWGGRLRQIAAGGKTITVDAHWTLLLDDNGNPDGVLKIHTDVSERLELEKRLLQSQKLEAIGQLTGGIAHDFNNLLTVIIGNADALIEELPDRKESLALLEMIRTAGERGAELTTHLLAFARRQALEPKAFRPGELIDGMRTLLQRTLGENIELAVAHASDVATVSVDPAQFESALLNLCINARDAMPNGGRLEIETNDVVLDQDYAEQRPDVEPGAYVRISVSDTGIGMSAEDTVQAFDPFFTTKPRGKGTGLGLSMVYGFTRQSGGHVAIYSELGHGTVVNVYLPQISSGPEPSVTDPPENVVRNGERILLVEDDALVRAHALRLLESLGYRVVSASDGPEALALLQKNVPCDLLFTDVIMPGGMTGPELAEAACALRPGLPVLYTSGYTDNAIVHGGSEDVDINLLRKPYRKQDLVVKLNEVLSHAQVNDGEG